jgi:peptidoglycan hydrolase-like amidase/putative cell wall-binding protein
VYAPLKKFLLALGTLTLVSVAVIAPSTPSVTANPGTESEILGVWVEGTGNGHGRGLSQWGAYGRALDGQTWQQILDAYYGGTMLGDATATDHLPAEPGQITVRMVSLDGFGTTGVISQSSPVQWNGQTATSMYAQWLSGSTYEVFASTARACPASTFPTLPNGPLAAGSTDTAGVTAIQRFLTVFGYDPGPIDGLFGSMTTAAVGRFQTASGLAVTGVWTSAEANAGRLAMEAADRAANWQSLGQTSAPVTFTTAVDETTAAGGEVLGLCNRNGTVTHYRGQISALLDSAGARRTVNRLGLENYLRGVVPRETPATWGNAGSGAGMNVLRAQAVAARSYALSQNRYTSSGSYAKTCDTTACQAYGGSAQRPGPSVGATVIEHPNTDRAVSETVGKVRRWPSGQVVSTEYSASNGARTAGGAFPAVDDPWDAQTANPNHVWTRFISASALRSRYGLSSVTSAVSEVDPNRISAGFEGIWANRVKISGGSTVTRTGWDFRGDFSLPSPGFSIQAVTRDVITGQSLAVIGDSILESVTGSGGPVPTLLNGVYSPIRFDAVSGRRTTGTVNGITDGVTAAGAVPVGTNTVLVHLGYNDPSGFAAKVDAVMSALRARSVGSVLWINLSERATGRGYNTANAALRDAQARWPELNVLDWNSYSSGAAKTRWFASDLVHLSLTGRAEFSRFVRLSLIGPDRGSQNLFGVPASLAGPDRVATAIEVARASHSPLGFSDAERPFASAAVLVSATSFADALAAGPLASAQSGPLLLTPPDRLDARVANTLTSLLAPGSSVHIVGGVAAVSAAVETAVAGLGFVPVRYAGVDRFDTAVKVAEVGIGSPGVIFVATGRNFADALAAGTVAARQGGAVLLTSDDVVPPVVAEYLEARPGLEVIAVGGPAARAFPGASRSFVGENRYATATSLAAAFPPANGVVGAANGERFPDALSATPYLARRGGVLLLVQTNSVTTPTTSYLRSRSDLERVQVFGGPAVVSDTTRAAISAALRS